MTGRARIRNRVDDAETVARAIRPDNTPEVTTRVEDGTVVTTIERETIGGLRTTVDDYVVNLTVALETVQLFERTYERDQDDE